MSLTIAALLIVSAAAIAGAVWAFWEVADAIDFRLRGYRVRRVERTDYTVWRPGLTDWLYEEATPERTRRGFRILREPVIGEAGYPRPCRVYVPNADAWDARMPSWARGRRDEIVARLRECFGSHIVVDDRDQIDGRLCASTLAPTDGRIRWWMWLPPQALVIPFAIAAVGPWAAIQLLSGRALIGGGVLSAWLGVICGLAWLAVRRQSFSQGVAVAGVLTLLLATGVIVILLSS